MKVGTKNALIIKSKYCTDFVDRFISVNQLSEIGDDGQSNRGYGGCHMINCAFSVAIDPYLARKLCVNMIMTENYQGICTMRQPKAADKRV